MTNYTHHKVEKTYFALLLDDLLGALGYYADAGDWHLKNDLHIEIDGATGKWRATVTYTENGEGENGHDG